MSLPHWMHIYIYINIYIYIYMYIYGYQPVCHVPQRGDFLEHICHCSVHKGPPKNSGLAFWFQYSDMKRVPSQDTRAVGRVRV